MYLPRNLIALLYKNLARKNHASSTPVLLLPNPNSAVQTRLHSPQHHSSGRVRRLDKGWRAAHTANAVTEWW